MPRQPSDSYDAFISYSHALDGALAPALQRGLQRFAKPWYRVRALRVFRDEASLSANPALWSSIAQALARSSFFILLASPRAAESRWVGREAEQWRSTKPIDTLFIALSDGELVWDEAAGDFDWERTSALPETLRGAFAEEPRWVDLRWARTASDLSLSHAQFRDAVAELAAPLHGVPKDELASEEVVQHRRTVRLARGAVATLAALTVAAVLFGVFAMLQRNEARRQRDLATSRSLVQAARANLDTRLDLAALLSLEAYRIEPSPETRSGLVEAVARTRHVTGVRHADQPIERIAFSPGRELLAGAGTQNVSLWDLSDPSAATTTVPVRNAKALAFSSDGTSIAVAGPRAVSLWRLGNTPTLAMTVRLHGALALAFVDGVRLGAVDTHGVVLVSTETGKTLRRWPLAHGISAADFASRVPVAAVAGPNRLSVVDLRRKSGAIGLPVPGIPRGVAIDATGGRVAALDLPGRTVTLWTRDTGAVRTRDLARVTTALAFDPAGKQLALGGSDGRVDLVSAALTGSTTTLRGPSGSIYDIAFPARGPLAAGGESGTIVLLDPRSTHAERVLGRLPPTFSLDFAENANTLAVAGFGNDVHVWDLDDGAGGPKAIRVSSDQRAVAVDASGARVVVAKLDGSVWLHDASGNRTMLRPPAAGSPDRPVAISSTGVVAWGSSGHIGRWDLGSAAQLEPLDVAGLPSSLAFSADGEELAIAGNRGVTVARLVEGRLSSEVIDRKPSVSVALGRSGDLVAFATSDRVTVWDTERQRVRFVTSIPLEATVALAFSPDDGTLGVGTSAGDVRFLDTDTGVGLGTPLSVPGGPVADIDFSPGGEMLATGTQGGVVTLLDDVLWSDVDAMEERLCEAAGRNLTPDEWREFVPGRSYEESCF